MELPQRLKSITNPFTFSNKLLNKTKKDFEIVISRYDEDISWCIHYRDFVTIYNKGDPIDYPYIKKENKGNLAETVLSHIIENYDRLADVTFFTHGSFNYRNDQLIKESGPCHKYWEDFISCDPGTLVYIERSDLPKSNDRIYDYNETIGDVYTRIFKKPYVPNFKWAPGTIISAGRDRIRSCPLDIYKRMLEFVLEPYENNEPSLNIYRNRDIHIERFLVHAFTLK